MSADKEQTYASIDDVQSRLAGQKYICDRNIATIVFLASRLGKPLLVEGPAGVGKTELAKVVATSLDAELIRLQCYEGLDEAKALYEWEYAKQLLYTQILKDKIGEVTAGTNTLSEAVDRLTAQDDVFFSHRFILERPLLRAISSEQVQVLLIDEIDKADAEFEAFLLEILSDFQVTIPEIGTIVARRIPVVVLTSNNAREMSDALKRRCMHLYIDFPSESLELEIVRLKVPEAGEELTVDNARKWPTYHPRCGTSFLVFVIIISIGFFAAVFPLLQAYLLPSHLSGAMLNLLQASVKIPLMIPIAGLSYEFIKWAGRQKENRVLCWLGVPGRLVQKITTVEPDDDQLEVALVSLKRALEHEGALESPDYRNCTFVPAA